MNPFKHHNYNRPIWTSWGERTSKTHSRKPNWKLQLIIHMYQKPFLPSAMALKPSRHWWAETGKSAFDSIWLTVCASKCVEKHLILLGECGKHFQLSRTPRTRWQMGRVRAWRGRGHFRTGCCSKPCGRQSKPICHKKKWSSHWNYQTKAQGEPLPAAQPGTDTHPAKKHHWKPPM